MVEDLAFAADLGQFEFAAVDGDVGRAVVADVDGGEGVPELGLFFEFAVVEAGAAAAGDDVDDAMWPGDGFAVEGVVDGPVVFVEFFSSCALFIAELDRFGALVVVDVSAKDDIDVGFVEEVGDEAHLFFALVAAAGVEAGLVEGDEPPGFVFAFGEVGFEPSAEFGVCPVDVGVHIKDGPVGIGVIEAVVGHDRVAVASVFEEVVFAVFGAGEGGRGFFADGFEGTVEGLVPVVEVGEGLGRLPEIAVEDVVVSGGGGGEGCVEEGDAVVFGGLNGGEVGVEAGLVLLGSSGVVDEVASEDEEVGVGFECLVSHVGLGTSAGSAVAKYVKGVGLGGAFGGHEVSGVDGFSALDKLVGDALAWGEVSELGGIDAVVFDAFEVDGFEGGFGFAFFAVLAEGDAVSEVVGVCLPDEGDGVGLAGTELDHRGHDDVFDLFDRFECGQKKQRHHTFGGLPCPTPG